jgi:putative heme-binding domain-containing protein
MNKNNLSVVALLFSAASFVGLSIFTAANRVSTPITLQVIAPVVTTPTAIAGSNAGVAAQLAVAQDDSKPTEERLKAIDGLASISGDATLGKEVFKKHCSACHKAEGDGADYAPDLTEVATRLTKQKIVESIVYPSAVVEEKYKTTMVATLDGVVVTGLLIEAMDDQVKIFDSKITHEFLRDDIDIMETKNLSSMPVKLPDAMGEGEFGNLVEYLAGLKKQ